jgi:uncharacterized protein YjbI with pentapeptide repeats
MAGRNNRTPKPRRSDPAPGPTADTVQPKLAPTAKKFAGKARDLESLRDAVVDAASVGAGLWLSYLFLFFYLFIAAAAVTHKDLFFENPVKLPFLNVELPLLGFFWLGPLLFIILQAYVLLHFALLADKVGVFHIELVTQIKDHDTRRRLRRQLPSNIFVQYLAGPRDVRDSVMGLMLRAIALITLVVFPIALLVFFQLQFLPYHDAWITWWHRFAVLLDILLLWMLWPSIAQGNPTWISRRDFSRGKVIALALFSLIPLLLVFTIATFPGEWLDANLPSFRFVPTRWPADEPKQSEEALDDNGNEPANAEEGKKSQTFWQKVNNQVRSMRWTSPHDLLVGGDVDLIARKPTSLWSNRLVLPGIDVINQAKFDSEDKIAAARETLSLRGRHLEGAVLLDAGLRKVDLTAADLSNAYLDWADLREAKFGCITTHKDTSDGDNESYEEGNNCARLKGAFLNHTKLSGAQLQRAELRGASLNGANLQGASLKGADLQGAHLDQARLQGATMDEAQLQDASLNSAELQGASMAWATLEGASMHSANLKGASLRGANLQGTWLVIARMQGANLSEALLKAHRWMAPS